jgi:hypothetical protein
MHARCRKSAKPNVGDAGVRELADALHPNDFASSPRNVAAFFFGMVTSNFAVFVRLATA